MQSAATTAFTRGRRAFAACALAGSIAVGLSACGSSGNSAASAAGTSTPSSSSRYAARLKAAECLRAHGIDVPDPSPNRGTSAGGGGGEGGAKIRQLLSTSAGQAATKACAADISKAFAFANITPAQRAQFRQDAVKYAECMRAHSISIPDPTINSAGGFGIFRSIPSSERNSPAFKSAFTACSGNLPNAGRFGRGGVGGNRVGGPGA